eukprot:gene26872-4481_t
MKIKLEGLDVYFPYEYIYPEQYQYMLELKRSLDARGHCLLEMPTGTGKTVTLLSLITSYQLAHPEVGKLVYCTRTVPEMEKVLAELKDLIRYRERYFESTGGGPPILAVGLSSRKNLCINPQLTEEGSRESVDAGCRRLTASWVRERAVERQQARQQQRQHGQVQQDMEAGPSGGGEVQERDPSQLCEFFEGHEKAGAEALLPPGVYTLEDLRAHGRKRGWCPYFLARHMLTFSNVVVYNYQYMIDPKVSQMVSRELEKECIVVFDEAHNIDNVCIEALSVNLRQQTLDTASRNLSRLSTMLDSAFPNLF